MDFEFEYECEFCLYVNVFFSSLFYLNCLLLRFGDFNLIMIVIGLQNRCIYTNCKNQRAHAMAQKWKKRGYRQSFESITFQFENAFNSCCSHTHQDPIQLFCNNSIAFFRCTWPLCVKLIITVVARPSNVVAGIKTTLLAAK